MLLLEIYIWDRFPHCIYLLTRTQQERQGALVHPLPHGQRTSPRPHRFGLQAILPWASCARGHCRAVPTLRTRPTPILPSANRRPHSLEGSILPQTQERSPHQDSLVCRQVQVGGQPRQGRANSRDYAWSARYTRIMRASFSHASSRNS